MSFDDIVEVKSTFPSPLGGAVFKGSPLGKWKVFSFRAARWIIHRTPAAGEFWRVEGETEVCDEYGDVVIVKNAFLHELPSYNYIGKLLKSHPAFRGFYFGDSKIDKLIGTVDKRGNVLTKGKIGDFALVGILNKGNYLALVDGGLSEPISIRVCDAWGELKEETEVATFLYEHKLDSSLASKILRLCEYDTVARLKRNPYTLFALSTIDKRHFKTIHNVAKKLEISPNDPRAVVGCVEYAMYAELERGDTIVRIADAKERVSVILGWIKSDVAPSEAIKQALEEKSICVLDKDGELYLQTLAVAYIEKYVEDTLVRLNTTPLVPNAFTVGKEELVKRLDAYSEELFQKEKYYLNEKQKEAVLMALTCRISVLSGFGGTGKTTILKAIIELVKTILVPAYVSALAGKAANRASQSIGEDAYTIHGLIQSIKNKDGLVAMDCDPLLIIDETSMLDISLICSLLKIFEGKTVRFLFVGDTAQLPPIGFGLFYHRLVETNINQVKLTEVYRQTAGSPLHKSAMQIREGTAHLLPIYNGQESGVYLLDPKDNPKKTLIELRRDIECMILTAYSSSKFDVSTTILNPRIQSMVNTPDESKMSIHLGGKIIGVGDPVIVTKNSLELALFNGMTGVVMDVVFKENALYCLVQFEGMDGLITLSRDQCWEVGIQLAYVITIHKSQGSEYDVCAIVLGSPMIENSALYTALTRTKKLCIIVGTQEQFDDAILKAPRHKTIQSGFLPVF
jgi:exodeoxyribonuclease V alpha subunit